MRLMLLVRTTGADRLAWAGRRAGRGGGDQQIRGERGSEIWQEHHLLPSHRSANTDTKMTAIERQGYCGVSTWKAGWGMIGGAMFFAKRHLPCCC
jgi:hypothetical protein